MKIFTLPYDITKLNVMLFVFKENRRSLKSLVNLIPCHLKHHLYRGGSQQSSGEWTGRQCVTGHFWKLSWKLLFPLCASQLLFECSSFFHSPSNHLYCVKQKLNMYSEHHLVFFFISTVWVSVCPLWPQICCVLRDSSAHHWCKQLYSQLQLKGHSLLTSLIKNECAHCPERNWCPVQVTPSPHPVIPG